MFGIKRKISFTELRKELAYKKSKEFGWFNKFMLWLNYIVILSLLLSYFAKYVSPQVFWPLAFLGIAWPILVALNLVFSLYWFAQLRAMGLWSILAILLGFNTFFSNIQFFSKQEKPNGNDIKVMSYNCMLFDLYNWYHNADSRNKIFEILDDESPDILCLQEFYTSEETNDFHNADTLVKFLKAKNIHTEFTTTLRGNDHWGVATLSKYPIINKGKIDFKTRANNVCIFTDVLIGKDTVRIYNMHLASIRFSNKDYKFVDDVINAEDTEELEGSKSILRLLKRGFKNRAIQADLVAEHMAKCTYKKIVCGDFNDTPSSYAYRTIKSNMQDAFVESGSGIGKTYAGKFPALRIDYIFSDQSFDVYNYQRMKATFTDHYPISCYLKIKS